MWVMLVRHVTQQERDRCIIDGLDQPRGRKSITNRKEIMVQQGKLDNAEIKVQRDNIGARTDLNKGKDKQQVEVPIDSGRDVEFDKDGFQKQGRWRSIQRGRYRDNERTWEVKGVAKRMSGSHKETGSSSGSKLKSTISTNPSTSHRRDKGGGATGPLEDGEIGRDGSHSGRKGFSSDGVVEDMSDDDLELILEGTFGQRGKKSGVLSSPSRSGY